MAPRGKLSSSSAVAWKSFNASASMMIRKLQQYHDTINSLVAAQLHDNNSKPSPYRVSGDGPSAGECWCLGATWLHSRVNSARNTRATKCDWGRSVDRYWNTWCRHQMETFSALLVLCAENSPVTGEFPSQKPVTRSFGVFFNLHLHKRLSKQ